MNENKMSKEEFVTNLLEALKVRLGEDYDISQKDATKNNGVVLTGIIIKDTESQITPVIYIEDLYNDYKEGTAFEEAVSNILNVYKHNIINADFDIREYTDFDRARKHIVYKLINAKANEELLDTCPHIEYLDLAIVFMIITSPVLNGFICIKNDLAKMWGVDEEELMDIARVNTPSIMKYNINSISKVLLDMGCKDPYLEKSMDDTMFIITNDWKTYGAATILYPDAMDDFSNRFGESFYILPSSVHELILIPASKMATSAVELGDIVKMVNSSTVEDTDILSDSVYYYDRSKKEVEFLCA